MSDVVNRYRGNATIVRLPMLLPDTVTAYAGLRAVVVDVDQRVLDGNGERWVLRLELHDGAQIALGGPAEAIMPVFTEPYPVCSCHGDPWPCNDAWAEQERQRAEQRAVRLAYQTCAGCGQDRNLGRLRYGRYPEARRYCRRVGCVREGERWERELHNARYAEQRAKTEFAQQMARAMGDGQVDL